MQDVADGSTDIIYRPSLRTLPNTRQSQIYLILKTLTKPSDQDPHCFPICLKIMLINRVLQVNRIIMEE